MTEEATPEQVVEFMTGVMKAAPEEIIVLLRIEIERLRAAERKATGTVVRELQAEIESLRMLNNQLLADCAKAETEIARLASLADDMGQTNITSQIEIERLKQDNAEMRELINTLANS